MPEMDVPGRGGQSIPVGSPAGQGVDCTGGEVREKVELLDSQDLIPERGRRGPTRLIGWAQHSLWIGKVSFGRIEDSRWLKQVWCRTYRDQTPLLTRLPQRHSLNAIAIFDEGEEVARTYRQHRHRSPSD